MKKKALISVYNKKNLNFICKTLNKYKIEIISSNGTAKIIKKLGYNVTSITKITKYKELLGGKVKSLHPIIHGSIMYDRKVEKNIYINKNAKLLDIDFIIVNLYPFEVISKKSYNIKEIIENIDIGGLSLLRSAAKNFQYVTAVPEIKEYDNFIKQLTKNNGQTSLKYRKKMATKVFNLSSKYDDSIYKWFLKNSKKNINNKKKINLKYGENPHQKSSLYIGNNKKTLVHSFLKQEKNFSHNNLVDSEAAINCLKEFSKPTCVIVKHANPCGVSTKKNINNAFNSAILSDKKSSFGGIVAINRKITKQIANNLINNFYSVIISPHIPDKIRNKLNIKKNLLLIEYTNNQRLLEYEIKNVDGGYIKQIKNNKKIIYKNIKCVSKKTVTKKMLNDIIFSMKVCKHVKSNAIVVVKNMQTIGIGAGQMSRVDSVKLAIKKKNENFKNINSFVAASDGFFPFADSIKTLIKNDCKAIIQPRGSINDDKIIKEANEKNISLYFIPERHFKH